MTFDEYYARYRLLRISLDKKDRMRSMLNRKDYRSFLDRFGGGVAPALNNLLITDKELEESIARRTKLAGRYAARLAKAAENIASPPLREYAVLRFVYGLTHEEIADLSFYSVRTVYRHSHQAKKALEAELRKIKPKAKKAKGKYRLTRGVLKKRNYKIDAVTASLIGFYHKELRTSFGSFPRSLPAACNM